MHQQTVCWDKKGRAKQEKQNESDLFNEKMQNTNGKCKKEGQK